MFRHVATGKPLSIEVVAAFLRLGNKYGIEVLRAEALKQLYRQYPSTLENYDNLDNSLSVDQSRWDHIDAVNLAREQGLLSVLPLALYECCKAHAMKILASGIPRGDGTTAVLSPTSMLACFAAWEDLAEMQSETTLSWIYNSAGSYCCESEPSCAGIRSRIIFNIFYPCVSFVGLDRHNSDLWWHESMCDYCDMGAILTHQRGRVKFWEALPGIFGLPEWAELRKERDELTW